MKIFSSIKALCYELFDEIKEVVVASRNTFSKKKQLKTLVNEINNPSFTMKVGVSKIFHPGLLFSSLFYFSKRKSSEIMNSSTYVDKISYIVTVLAGLWSEYYITIPLLIIFGLFIPFFGLLILNKMAFVIAAPLYLAMVSLSLMIGYIIFTKALHTYIVLLSRKKEVSDKEEFSLWLNQYQISSEKLHIDNSLNNCYVKENKTKRKRL